MEFMDLLNEPAVKIERGERIMALKRKNRIEASFSMASMTDVIFLLLIFFMVTSTFVFPNAIKVNLPQSKQQTTVKPLARVTIDASLNYYVSVGKAKAVEGGLRRIASLPDRSPQSGPRNVFCSLCR